MDNDGEVNCCMDKYIQKQLSGPTDQDNKDEDEDELIWDQYCKNIESVDISWSFFSSNKGSYLFKLISHPKIDGWVRLDIINKLHPRLAVFVIRRGSISAAVLDDILIHLKDFKTSTWLFKITIIDPINQEMSLSDAVQQYSDKFQERSWKLKCDEGSDESCLELFLHYD